VLNNNGQTSGQITAQAAFANAISLLNTSQATATCSRTHYRYGPDAPADVILNGIGARPA